MQKLIARGAEAILIREGNFLVKDRIKKGYRLSCLDEKLRKSRTKSEAKLLEKVSFLINAPKVIETDEKEKIEMEFIEGKKLSDHLDKLENREQICEEIGKQVAALHDNDIIHGDLTTSNMIYAEDNEGNPDNVKKTSANHDKLKKDLLINKNNIDISNKGNLKVYFIDFGLGFYSKRIEDKAVDLHLLRQALEAKHFSCWKSLFDSVIKGYKSKDKEKILKQLEKVEARGRYKKH